MTRKVFLITGKTGTGKSRLVKQLRQSFERTITLDPLEEYEGTIFFDFVTFRDYVADHVEENFSLVCRFTDEQDIDLLFQAVWFVERCTLIVEEANLFFDPHSKIQSFHRLVAQGRHKEISLLCVSQRVPELPISFRAQRNTIVTFQQTEPYDLKLLEGYGFDPVDVSELISSRGYDSLIEGTHYLVIGESLDGSESEPEETETDISEPER